MGARPRGPEPSGPRGPRESGRIGFSGTTGIIFPVGKVSGEAVDFGRLKSSDFEAKVDFRKKYREIGQLCGEDGTVPARILSDLVVGQSECTLFGPAQTGNCDDGNVLQTQQLCRVVSPGTGEDISVFIDEDRIRPSETQNAVGDLLDLLFRMTSRVALAKPQLGEGGQFRLEKLKA